VAFTVQGWTPAQVQQALLRHNIQVAASGMGFAPLDMQGRGLDAVVRASVAWHTTPANISALTQALHAISV
jgi:selenocysteine lyase/cysteine desulfurase